MLYKNYYVNDYARANCAHEVHVNTCSRLAHVSSKTYLGYLATCQEAIAKAKTIYDKVNGCPDCCKECHDIDQSIE